MTDTLPTESQVAEHQRRMARFPYGYGMSACSLLEGLMWRATLRGFGGVTLWSGELFRDWIDANGSTVPMARTLVAAKLREVRKSPRPPKIPRLHQRQAWRWPEDIENVRNWRGMQSAWGIAGKD